MRSLLSFLFPLFAISALISAVIKYLAPRLISLDLIPEMQIQAIALIWVTLPVLVFAILVWQESSTK